MLAARFRSPVIAVALGVGTLNANQDKTKYVAVALPWSPTR